MSGTAERSTEQSPEANPSSGLHVWLLVILGVLIYWNSLRVPVMLDDHRTLYERDAIQKLWPPMDARRPLGYYTFQLQYQIHQREVFGYHVVNIAIHLGSAWVLMELIRRTLLLLPQANWLMGREAEIAWAMALFWMVHPLQTSAVTYLMQRQEAQMSLFYLLVLYGANRASTSTLPGCWYALAVFSFALALATKEVAATCPLVLLLYDRAFLSQSWRQVWAKAPALYLPLLVPLAWLVWILKSAPNVEEYAAGFGLNSVTPWGYLRSQPEVLLHYLRLAIWPDRLCFDYGWPIAVSPWHIYPAGLAIVALLGCSLVAWFRSPPIGFLGLSFFLLLAPTSSFMPIADLAFEHRMYLALAPVVILVVLGMDRLLINQLPDAPTLRRWQARLLFIAVALLCLRTVLRNQDYATYQKMWKHVTLVAPQNARGHTNLALAYDADWRGLKDLGQTVEADARFEAMCQELDRAIELDPRSYRTLRHRAVAYGTAGNLPAALAMFAECLRIEPKYVEGWYYQAKAQIAQREFAAAKVSIQKLHELQPDWLPIQTITAELARAQRSE